MSIQEDIKEEELENKREQQQISNDIWYETYIYTLPDN